MRVKNAIIALLLILISVPALAQSSGIEGTVINRLNRKPVDKAKVTVVTDDNLVSSQTAEDGSFRVVGIPEGTFSVRIEADGYLTTEMNIKFEGYVKDLMDITIAPDVSTGDLDDALFAEFDGENEAGYEDIPSVLSSTKDVYDNIAGYKFSSMRHLARGYESSSADVYINGILFNDALTGYTPWSLFSGLNEATREKETTTGLQSTDYGAGGINGSTNIITKASKVKKGWRTSALTNSSSYRIRLMATYSSGEMDNGWAYSASVSTRLGGNDWVTGVYYKAFAYYLGVEKNIHDMHRFSLSVFGSPVQRGVQSATTQEVYDLVGSNYYNPNWGYQNGKVRNARVRNNHEPVAILNYEFTPSFDTKLAVAVSYRMGRNGYQTLDWYDAADPRPDYYRNLPSYFDDDPQKAGWAKEGWMTDDNIRHIDWERLYNVNYNSYFDEGTYSQPIDYTNTNRSKYILGERRTDQNDINANVAFTQSFGRFKMNVGYNYRWNRTEYYQVITDLLGGDYWLDVDQFAERDFGSGDAIQNDLNNPNRLVKVGDKYSYDYYAHVRNHRAWLSLKYNIKGFEAVLSGDAGYNTFWREGLYKKGLFPDNSFGASEKQNFFTYTGKLGLSYKFNGQNIIYANAGYMTRAPFFQESFLSPRTRNTVANGLTTEKILSADLNYSLRVGEFALRISAFYTEIKDQTDLISFYDDLQRSYTNFAMRGIDQRNIGVEAGIRVPLFLPGLSLGGAVSYGIYEYTSDPYVTQTVDNSNKVVAENMRVYWNGYKVPSTPQLAANIGLNYRSPNYLFAGIDLGYYDMAYISMNPLRRTDEVTSKFDTKTPEGMAAYKEMVIQEKFPRAFLLGANIGKSWYIQRKYNLGVNLNVNNILNNRNIKTGGFEQMRLSKNEDASGNIMNYTAFDSKYFYLHGINYMVNVYFRF